MSKKVEKIAWIIFILMFVLLFISSSMTYKQQSLIPTLSNSAMKNQPFYEFFSKIHINYNGVDESIAKIGYFNFIEFIIRKSAHFGSYFILGASLWVILFNKVNSKIYLFFLSLLSTSGLAAFDEFHQQLTGGRSPLVSDVMIDTMGAFVGIVLTIFIYIIIERRKNYLKH